MPEWLVDTFTRYPYLGVGVVFVLCGIGLPLPEEIVLVAAGYACFKGLAHLWWMIGTCTIAILLGDIVPYLLGRVFGSRLLRLRWMRLLVTKRRLSKFDRWFRQRGDLVIFFARFLAGVRTVAYFTAGTMKMPVRRFITLDLIGIAVVVPLLVGIGYSSGHIIDDVIDKVERVERDVLIGVGVAAVLGGTWWLLRRRRRPASAARPRETFVELPSPPPAQQASTARDDQSEPQRRSEDASEPP